MEAIKTQVWLDFFVISWFQGWKWDFWLGNLKQNQQPQLSDRHAQVLKVQSLELDKSVSPEALQGRWDQPGSQCQKSGTLQFLTSGFIYLFIKIVYILFIFFL